VTHRPALLSGIAVVAVYCAAAAATGALRDSRVRPLYDGFAPAPTYQFVDPPAFFAPGNVKPHAVSRTIALDESGSEAAGLSTPDGQFVVDLARDAVPAAAGATAVTMRITPLAPRTLGALPDGLRATGNAYRLELTYDPTSTRVERLAHPGSVLVETPEVAERLFSSPDGATWSKLPARSLPPRQLSMAATLPAPGYYVAATSLPELTAAPARRRDNALALGAAIAVVALCLFVAAFLIAAQRRKRRQAGS
jgi:hypothetical protein